MDKTVLITGFLLFFILAFFGLLIWLVFFNPFNNKFISLSMVLIFLAFPILYFIFSKEIINKIQLLLGYCIAIFIGLVIFFIAWNPNDIVSDNPTSFTLYSIGVGALALIAGLMISKKLSVKLGTILLGAVVLLYVLGTFFVANPGDIISNNLWIVIVLGSFASIAAVLYVLDKLKIITFKDANISSILKNLLLTIVIISVILGFIYLITYLIENQSNASDFSLIFFNLLILFVFIAFVVKYFKLDEKLRKKPGSDPSWGGLILKIILYVPCLIIDLVEYLKEQYNITPKVVWQLLFLEIILILGRFLIPYLYNYFMNVKGNTLLKDPEYINKETFLSNFEDLNYYVSDDVDSDASKDELPSYHYCISCWIWLDSFPPNTNVSYTQDNSILNVGNKPNIQFNVLRNELIVRMKINSDEEAIVLRKKNLLKYQKWNNIVVNYDGGTLDIFINNELISTKKGIIPYKQYDIVSAGSEGGIHGGICNVKYFNTTLSRNEINWLYNTTKLNDPPII
jgi:hypothetical protein